MSAFDVAIESLNLISGDEALKNLRLSVGCRPLGDHSGVSRDCVRLEGEVLGTSSSAEIAR
jgi:hypothetical protein